MAKLDKCKKIILSILILTAILTVCGCSEHEAAKNTVYSETVKTYTNERFKFSVEYPEGWDSEVDESWSESVGQEANPDEGIRIYAPNNKDNWIYVFGQVGHIGLPYDSSMKKEEYTTDSNIKGYEYTWEGEGRKNIFLILNEGFLGAIVNMDLESYKKYEKQISNILKSIK